MPRSRARAIWSALSVGLLWTHFLIPNVAAEIVESLEQVSSLLAVLAALILKTSRVSCSTGPGMRAPQFRLQVRPIDPFLTSAMWPMH